MATIMPILRHKFYAADGTPLAFGKVFTYEAASLVPKATYTDKEQTGTNTNPIILDASGEADIWLGSGYYKIVLTDSSDAVIDTVDYIGNVFETSDSTLSLTSLDAENIINDILTMNEQGSDPSLPPLGQIKLWANSNGLNIAQLGNKRLFLTNTGSQVVTNKDIDGETASNTSRWTLPKNTRTNLDALTRKEGTIVFDSDAKKALLDNGSSLISIGSGSSNSNLISDGDAEGPQIMSLYTLTAATRPSGSLTPGAGGLTVSLTSTDPLQGTKSFLISKGAVNAQGQAAVIDFTAPLASSSATHIITLDYAVVSGTFTAGSDSADSSMIVYIRDTVTGFIQPTNFKFYSNVQGQFTGSFQVSSLTASRAYQLLFYVAETSTSAWSMKFDNIQVIKDISATAIFDVAGEMTLTGTQSLTSGVTTKIAFASVGSQKGIVADTVNNRWVVQTAGRYVVLLKTAPSGNVSINHTLIYKNGSAVSNIGSSFTVADNAVSQTCFHVGNFIAGDYIEGFCRLDGSSPSLVASNWTTLSVFMVSANTGLSGNPHIAKASLGSAQSIPNATHTLVTTGLSATASFDTATLYDGTNKRMVVKETAYYEIDYGGVWPVNSTGSRVFSLSIDGGGSSEGTIFEPSGSDTGLYRASVKTRLNAGQTVGLMAYQTSGGALNLTGGFLGITKIVDPQSLLNNVAASAPTVQRFTSGSGTYTTPANVKYIQVEMVGGGGGGQGSRETTWAAGAGAGGNTSFGTRTANGGAGGNITGGIGGTVAGSGYTVLASCNGGDGSSGSVRASGGVTEISSGSGAASPFGGNGGGRISGVVGLAGAGNTGSGGSGAGLSTTFSGTSGAGGGAGAYYKFLINNPAATYSYAVGAGGTGGAAGTNGFVGGAGGSGVIIVTEYYS